MTKNKDKTLGQLFVERQIIPPKLFVLANFIGDGETAINMRDLLPQVREDLIVGFTVLDIKADELETSLLSMLTEDIKTVEEVIESDSRVQEAASEGRKLTERESTLFSVKNAIDHLESLMGRTVVGLDRVEQGKVQKSLSVVRDHFLTKRGELENSQALFGDQNQYAEAKLRSFAKLQKAMGKKVTSAEETAGYAEGLKDAAESSRNLTTAGEAWQRGVQMLQEIAAGMGISISGRTPG